MSTFPLRSRTALPHAESFASAAALPAAARALFGTGHAPGFQSTQAWFELVAATAIPDGAAASFVLCTEAGQPTALFPMLDGADGSRGSLTSPYTTLYQPLVAQGLDPAAQQRAARAFARLSRRWSTLRLEALDAAWEGLLPFEAGVREAGLAVRRYRHFGNWREALAGRDWAGYLADRPGQLRETIRRKTRACDRDGRVAIEIVADPAALGPAIAAYEAVHSRSWKDPEPYPQFGPAMMRAAAEAGVLRVGVLRHDGIAGAAQYWTVANGQASVLKLAHDESLKPLSPGTVLTAHMLRYLIDHEGVGCIDFGRGDDEYKRGWAGERRQRIGLLLANPRRLPGLLALGRDAVGRARRTLQGGAA